jgi:WD40 repeat protein
MSELFNSNPTTETSIGERYTLVESDENTKIFSAIPAVVEIDGNPTELTTDITCVAFSPKDHQIALGISDNSIQLLASPEKPTKVLNGHHGKITCMTFSSDGTLCISGSEDSTLRLWNTNDCVLSAMHHVPAPVVSVALSPDNQFIAAGCSNGQIHFFNINGKRGAIIEGHKKGISSLAFGRDGQQLISASWDKTVRLWQCTSQGHWIQMWQHPRDNTLNLNWCSMFEVEELSTLNLELCRQLGASPLTVHKIPTERGHTQRLVSPTKMARHQPDEEILAQALSTAINPNAAPLHRHDRISFFNRTKMRPERIYLENLNPENSSSETNTETETETSTDNSPSPKPRHHLLDRCCNIM